MQHPIDRIAHTTAFVTPVVEHMLDQEITQRIHHEGLIRTLYHEATSRSIKYQQGHDNCGESY